MIECFTTDNEIDGLTLRNLKESDIILMFKEKVGPARKLCLLVDLLNTSTIPVQKSTIPMASSSSGNEESVVTAMSVPTVTPATTSPIASGSSATMMAVTSPSNQVSKNNQ